MATTHPKVSPQRVKELKQLAQRIDRDEGQEIRRTARQLLRQKARARELIRQLRDRRIATGLSLADVAERTGIDKSALSRMENLPDANPTLETLLRYGDAIGVALAME